MQGTEMAERLQDSSRLIEYDESEVVNTNFSRKKRRFFACSARLTGVTRYTRNSFGESEAWGELGLQSVIFEARMRRADTCVVASR